MKTEMTILVEHNTEQTTPKRIGLVDTKWNLVFRNNIMILKWSGA